MNKYKKLIQYVKRGRAKNDTLENDENQIFLEKRIDSLERELKTLRDSKTTSKIDQNEVLTILLQQNQSLQNDR